MTAKAKHLLTLHWVVGGLAGDEASGHRSTLASTRYRAIIPARELRAMGHRVALIDARRWHWDPQRRPDVVVVGKLLRHGSDDDFLRHCDKVFAQVNQAREAGVPVVADFCDDHFDHPLLGGPWRWLANQAVLCTAASQRMADAVSMHTASPVAVIGDPLASPAGEPRVFEAEQGLHRVLARWLPKVFKKRLRLVWFGHPNNFPPMARWAEELVALAAERPMTLTLVTGPNGEDTRPLQQIEEWIDTFNLAHAPRMIISLTPWSEESQWGAVQLADMVLIPSQAHKENLGLKSSNRLADALNAGRYVVASAVPSYRPFDAFCALTEEPAKALQWMIHNPKAARTRIESGQQLVQELASTAAVAHKWLEAAIHATTTPSDHIADPSLLVANVQLRPAGSVPRAMTMADRNLPQTAETTGQALPPPVQYFETSPPTRPTLLDLHLGKDGKVPDKWEAYFPAYERLFSPLRDQAVKLLEIGVQNGGSLEVWAEYFSNAAQITGCDIDPKCGDLQYFDSRIDVVIGDATAKRTRTQIMEICDTFDVVIDDGSHLSSDIVNAFLSYFPLLKPGGLYVVEDTHALYRPVPGGGVLSETSAHKFFKLCAELINLEHWQGQVPIETLMSTFINRREDIPVWLTQGGIESVEFCNSMVVVRKAEGRAALGRRLVSGAEAIVHPSVLKHQAKSPHHIFDMESNHIGPSSSVLGELSDREVAHGFFEAGSVRLNLGCGDKILPGYINVDVAASRSGKQPDIICDLRDLSLFGKDYADEVLAVHVVEHFWRWEVEDILRSWLLVLKPGGRMILECPNLISACEEFLKDPKSRCQPSQDGQRTMWVFYGDPSWRDPLMVHRWAYTPDSLSDLLKAVGLVDIRQEPAQFKLREPRDMRVTGRKALRP